MRLWIKDPLAILADGAERGLVVEGSKIAELVARDAAGPTAPAEGLVRLTVILIVLACLSALVPRRGRSDRGRRRSCTAWREPPGHHMAEDQSTRVSANRRGSWPCIEWPIVSNER